MVRKRDRKRGNGQGSAYQRKDGRWVAALTIETGKRKCYYGSTKKEAEDLLVAARKLRDRGDLSTTTGRRTGPYLLEWLELVKRPAVRPTTYGAMEARMKRVASYLGAIPLGNLTQADIQRLYADLGRTLAPSTIRTTHAYLSDALNTAEQWGYLRSNPCRGATLPKLEKRQHVTPAAADLTRLLDDLAAHAYHPLYLLLALTGMRVGEALGLRWSDVADDCSAIHIRHTLRPVRGGGGAELGPVKTDAARRTITCKDGLQRALREHRQGQRLARIAAPVWQDLDFVFTESDGQPIGHQRVSRVLDAALTRCAMPHMRVHDLRHTVATMLGQSGVLPQTIQHLLGHASVTTTLSTYAHVLTSMEHEAMQVMEDAIGL